jgi:hypothetical protein
MKLSIQVTHHYLFQIPAWLQSAKIQVMVTTWPLNLKNLNLS